MLMLEELGVEVSDASCKHLEDVSVFLLDASKHLLDFIVLKCKWNESI